MQRTIDEVIYPNITMKSEFGQAEVQMMTRFHDPVTGKQIGSDQYHRHVLDADADDTDEHPSVRRARATFIDAAMRERWEAAKARIAEEDAPPSR